MTLVGLLTYHLINPALHTESCLVFIDLAASLKRNPLRLLWTLPVMQTEMVSYAEFSRQRVELSKGQAAGMSPMMGVTVSSGGLKGQCWLHNLFHYSWRVRTRHLCN